MSAGSGAAAAAAPGPYGLNSLTALAACLPAIASAPLLQHKERRRVELYALNAILAR